VDAGAFECERIYGREHFVRITRLRLVNFRRFDDGEFKFSPGLNLIRGPNESGKSTIVRALVAALFEKPDSTAAKRRYDLRWGTEEEPLLELDFTEDGGQYRLFKDFGARKVALEQPGEAKPLGSAKAVDARLAELLGFRDPAQYLRTACVTHDQMVSLGEDVASAKKLAAMLREVVMGGRESGLMERAVRQLTAEVDELKRGLERATHNPGTIRRLQDEREMYMLRQKDLSLGAGDLEEQRERLAEVEGLIEKKAERLGDLSQLLEKNRTLSDVETRLEASRERFEAADRAVVAAARLEVLDKQIETEFHGFGDLDPAADAELRKEINLRESLCALRQELAAEAPTEEEEPEEEPVAEPTPPVPRPARSRKVGTAGMAAGLVLIILGVVLGSVVHPALFSIIALGALLLGAGSYWLAATAPAHDEAPAQAEALEEEEPEEEKPLDEPLVRAEAEVGKLEARERDFLESVGCDDAESFFKRFAGYRELLLERKDVAAGFKALLGRRSYEQLEAERRRALLDVATCDEKIAELSAFRLEPEKLEAMTREHKMLATELDELQTERDGLSFHLVKTASDPEEAVKIEEVLTWLWEAEQSARRRLRVYTLARDAMQQASAEMLSSAVPVLAESVGRTFSRLTAGRYDDIEVRESDLAISVYSPEKGTMIPGDELLATLSKGTASQLYLSARLELVDLLSGGRKPPLIFDDSFSYFDERRLAGLWEILEDVSLSQQVLVFTCTDRYDELARGVNVIDLSR
jgi:DNA repair exonuclease SbcCD ATPase subunit